ncbi:cyclic GMP-AMP synthase-like isoform X2 [Mauremys reevesii]|nr:cyclic GMP-AMP synthase-like isoform X2 [Mauremys reevesii]XP_039367949.1 cyclic GMP-AMP synthase-like isoform X2 [Mauremys reevesii]XP_039367950.1 cyclic GMP-AMP synthase-like isoform X2 [Mauremys reevesii]
MADPTLSASSPPLSVMPAKNRGVWKGLQRKGRAGRSKEPGYTEGAASQQALSPLDAAESSNLRARKQWNLDTLGSHPPETSQQLRSLGTHSRWKVELDKLHREAAGDRGQVYSQDASADLSEKPGTSAAMRTFQDWKKDNLTRIKERAKSLRLKQLDVAKAVDLLHAFFRQFFSYLNECPERPYFRDVRELTLGSSYKLLHPNEFDVLLSLPIPDYIQYAEVEGYDGLFYTLTLLRRSRSFPAAFLLEDGQTVSPGNIMAEFRQHLDQFIKVFYSVPFPGWQMRLERKKQNSSAVPLVMVDNRGDTFMSIDLVLALEISGQWPSSDDKGMDIKQLLGEKEPYLRKTLYFIAKQAPGQDNKETWKISFSHVEKEIWKSHTSTRKCQTTTCRRPECLQMLESLLGALKTEHPLELGSLSSYHAETSFFHTLLEWKQDQDGNLCSIAHCFERVQANFIQQVATAHLPHFFIPKCNLFGTKFFPPNNLKFLLARLREKQKKKQSTTVSRKKKVAALPLLDADMSWPLMITVGLMVLVSIGLSHFGS